MPEHTDRPPDLRATGERIETLLEASSAGGRVSRERAEELVRLVADLYGAGLQRLLEILDEEGALSDEALDALAADDLVASLLLVHGLHPRDLTDRVEAALESVRPYLASHGGDVELAGITEDGVVRLRLLGSCDGCASSAATMSLAVEDAISAAAPEITGFDLLTPVPSGRSTLGPRLMLPLEVLDHGTGTTAGRPQPAAPAPRPGGWHLIAGVDALASGEVLGTVVGGLPVIVCRNGDDLLAFRDECAGCGASLRAARLERRLGGATGAAVLTCPRCRAHYDVRQAGAAIEADGTHLDPLPLLTRAGAVEIAVPAGSLG